MYNWSLDCHQVNVISTRFWPFFWSMKEVADGLTFFQFLFGLVYISKLCVCIVPLCYSNTCSGWKMERHYTASILETLPSLYPHAPCCDIGMNTASGWCTYKWNYWILATECRIYANSPIINFRFWLSALSISFASWVWLTYYSPDLETSFKFIKFTISVNIFPCQGTELIIK